MAKILLYFEIKNIFNEAKSLILRTIMNVTHSPFKPIITAGQNVVVGEDS